MEEQLNNLNLVPLEVENDNNVENEQESVITNFDLLKSEDLDSIFKNSTDITFNNYYDSESLLFKNPLILNNRWEQIALHYLPHDTRIEIECSLQPHYNKKVFDEIPDIVENVSSTDELRFRIPPGLKGFCCLFNICEALKANCLYSESGIHYHIDMRHIYKNLVNQEFMNSTQEYILTELESWNYKGTYNAKKLGGWYKFQAGFETIDLS